MIVVDASVWVSRLVPEDVHHEACRHWLASQEEAGEVLVSPVLLLVEVAGAIARRTGDSGLAKRAVAGILRLPTLRVVPVDRRLGLLSVNLAADLMLRGADAVYVAVARDLGIPLVTLDREQRQRAARFVTVRLPH